jgi:hypothetical protein
MPTAVTVRIKIESTCRDLGVGGFPTCRTCGSRLCGVQAGPLVPTPTEGPGCSHPVYRGRYASCERQRRC